MIRRKQHGSRGNCIRRWSLSDVRSSTGPSLLQHRRLPGKIIRKNRSAVLVVVHFACEVNESRYGQPWPNTSSIQELDKAARIAIMDAHTKKYVLVSRTLFTVPRISYEYAPQNHAAGLRSLGCPGVTRQFFGARGPRSGHCARWPCWSRRAR